MVALGYLPWPGTNLWSVEDNEQMSRDCGWMLALNRSGMPYISPEEANTFVSNKAREGDYRFRRALAARIAYVIELECRRLGYE